jgi:hypothetical protein
MHIVDVSPPGPLRLLGRYETKAWISRIAVHGSTAYLSASGDELQVVDVSDPRAPRQVGALPFYPASARLLVEGRRLLSLSSAAAGAEWRLSIHDLADPTRPKWMLNFPIPGSDMALQGACLVVTGGSHVRVFDVSDFNQPRPLSELALPSLLRGLAATETTLYASSQDLGLVTLGYRCPVTAPAPQLLYLPFASSGGR